MNAALYVGGAVLAVAGGIWLVGSTIAWAATRGARDGQDTGRPR